MGNDELRERAIDAISETKMAGEGLTAAGKRRVCEVLADAVLDALGLEQVGWMIPHDGGPDGGIIHDETDVPHLDHDECEPVYRLAAPSSSEGQ